MSLPAVRLWIPLSAGFSDKYHVFLLSILGHCFNDVSSWSLGKTILHQMLHLTQVKTSTWWDRYDNVCDWLLAPKLLQCCMRQKMNKQAQCEHPVETSAVFVLTLRIYTWYRELPLPMTGWVWSAQSTVCALEITINTKGAIKHPSKWN